ncbi:MULTISPECIES: DUF2231 domain-containing protein [Nocardia]|uniref:DUF2231 domain-containing protein n=2 Tax=Nocardia TaxID=1817 RepID=A0A2T2YTQ7_9NOCA|nr:MULTISPECIES: DUF2231 domain-containing protein [Nocardia]MBF6244488.1 hypothetical protein [Nocardia elegans]MBF6447858.1 hypothetical protein [Nocardia elegans]PSR58869.1 hypothetical protein C8259_29255 [Nocardia nova]
MTVIHNLPAHVLFVHFIVVLVPLTAILEIVCALWPAARRGHLVWLTLTLAVIVMVLTPITIHAGQWLYNLRRNPDEILREHAERGETMLYFAIALLVVAVALTGLHLAERRGTDLRTLITVTVAVLAVVVAVASIVQTYRVGDAGSQSVWGDEIARLQKNRGD